MREISRQRWLVEHEGGNHSVKRGKRGKLHFENMPKLQRLLGRCLKLAGFNRLGVKNALDLRPEEVSIGFSDLPAAFDGARILLLTDLHINELPDLADTIIDLAQGVEYDFCVLGGDYSFGYGKSDAEAYPLMERIATALCRKSDVYGVMGNHDLYDMAEMLERIGVVMLNNESVSVERGSERIVISGVDDCHYYGADDIDLAMEGVDEEAFRVMICHSPENYARTAQAGYSLYLAGHTHGGQVCLPGGVAVVTCATVPRKILKGRWNWESMAGYTSRGAGSSGIPVRFFCPPEAALITLVRE